MGAFEPLHLVALFLVIVLDLVALFRVRRRALAPVAALLWTIWIIVAPIVGAVSSFIVATSSEKSR
jgi:hypothetical protein